MSRSAGPLRSVVVVCAALGVAVGAVAVADTSAVPPAGPPPARELPVAAAAAACPAGSTPAGGTSTVTTVVPRLQLPPAAGRAELVQLDSRKPVAAQPGLGTAESFERAATTRTVFARATGGYAPGFAAGQLSRTLRHDDRSLAGGACAAPGGEFWFVGGSTEPGRRGRLWLVNPTDAPAAVDVSVYGPDGLVDSPVGQGILVPPFGQEVVGLDALAPGLPYVAAHVEAHQGRVAAALVQRETAGLTPLGADWVPPAAGPARDVIVPGVLAAGSSRRLRILVPGSSDAVVRLELLTSAGEPGAALPGGTPLQVVEARAGAVTEVDLTRAVGAPAAVRLRSDVPVTAGVELRRGAELGYTAAATPQPGPAVLPQNRRVGSVLTVLVLSAADQAARVRVTPIVPGRGTAPARIVSVPAGRTVVASIAVQDAPDFALVVAPEAGAVVGARYIIEGTGSGELFTAEPLTPARVTTRMPAVVADLSVPLPRPPRS